MGSSRHQSTSKQQQPRGGYNIHYTLFNASAIRNAFSKTLSPTKTANCQNFEIALQYTYGPTYYK